MAQPLEDELAAITGPAAPQGVRRRADVSYTTEKPDYAKELDASFSRVGSYVPAVTGLARQIGGDQEGAMADYRRSAAIEAEADSRDSNQSTDWRDIDGVGSALGFARKMAAQSAPDALLSLGAGGVPLVAAMADQCHRDHDVRPGHWGFGLGGLFQRGQGLEVCPAGYLGLFAVVCGAGGGIVGGGLGLNPSRAGS